MHPVQSSPPHCPQWAAVQVLLDADDVVVVVVEDFVVVVAVVDVLLFEVVLAVLVLLDFEVVDPPVDEELPLSLTVTTPLEGTEMVTEPPDSVAVVDAKVLPWSVTQAEAELGVNPLNERAAEAAELPLLVNTTTMEPSVFLKAPITTSLIVPLVLTRTAPGRMYLDHMAKAQKILEGVTFPSTTSTRWEADCVSPSSKPSQKR